MVFYGIGILRYWYGFIWYSIVWYCLLVLCRYTTLWNFELIAWKMTELWLFEEFGMIWYFRGCSNISRWLLGEGGPARAQIWSQLLNSVIILGGEGGQAGAKIWSQDIWTAPYVWNLTLWYFLLLTLDFAWKYRLSNMFPSTWFEVCMIIAF